MADLSSISVENRMDDEQKTELCHKELANLNIFMTDDDKTSTDITKMSNFFDTYIKNTSLAIQKNSKSEVVMNIPSSMIGSLNEVIHTASTLVDRGTTYIPDFDNLPSEIKAKLKKGVYKLGESRQVDGNARAVIVDQTGGRIRDVTLKKVTDGVDLLDKTKNLTVQLQLQQIYQKLGEISELQEYQLETDRNSRIIVPFFSARDLILKANNATNQSEHYRLLEKADELLINSLNELAQDISTTSNHLAKQVSIPFGFGLWGKTVELYTNYLSSDLFMITQFTGVRMQLLENLGKNADVEKLMTQYKATMKGLVTKPLTKKKQTAISLLHGYTHYNGNNMDLWLHFGDDISHFLSDDLTTAELPDGGNEIYIVSMEDADDEQGK